MDLQGLKPANEIGEEKVQTHTPDSTNLSSMCICDSAWKMSKTFSAYVVLALPCPICLQRWDLH